MRPVTTEFKVGLFTLVAAVLIAYMFFFLNPKGFNTSGTSTYFTRLQDAQGIVSNSHVRTNGVLIGKVLTVALDEDSTRITLEVDSQVRMPVGTKVEVRNKGFFGDVFIEIVRAPDSGEYIENGGFIPHSSERLSMAALVGIAGDIARDVKKVTQALSGAVGGEDGGQRLGQVLENIESLTRNLSGVVGDNRNDVRDLVANLKSSTAQLSVLLKPENREKLERIIASFDTSMNDVQSATKNIKLIAERVERGEGSLGKLLSDNSTAQELESAIRDVRELLAPARRLEIDVDYHMEARSDQVAQNYFNLHFRTRPDRYYLLGLTDHRFRTTEVQTTVQEGGDPTTEGTTRTETTRTQEAIRFNAQFAKRWHFFALRFGLFESTGGIASDIYLLKDRLRLSAEAFQWDTRSIAQRRTAHFKAYMNLLMFKHIYLTLGADDLTRTDPTTGSVRTDPNVFLGAGLAFNDQDIKAVFGAAALAK